MDDEKESIEDLAQDVLEADRELAFSDAGWCNLALTVGIEHYLDGTKRVMDRLIKDIKAAIVITMELDRRNVPGNDNWQELVAPYCPGDARFAGEFLEAIGFKVQVIEVGVKRD